MFNNTLYFLDDENQKNVSIIIILLPNYYFLFISLQNAGYVQAFPHATPGYIPSPIQSNPYLTSPLAHINPAMMSLYTAAAAGAAVSSPTTIAEHQSAAAAMAISMAGAADHTSRSVQMHAALLPTAHGMSVHSQFQQHPAAQQLQLAHQHKAKAAGDRVEVRSVFSIPSF
jgi:hypothetical protein